MKKTTKDKKVTIRLSQECFDEWLTAAEADHRTLVSWIVRQCATSKDLMTAQTPPSPPANKFNDDVPPAKKTSLFDGLKKDALKDS